MASFLRRWQPGLGHAVRIELLIAGGVVHPAILWFLFFANVDGLMLGTHTAFGYDFVYFWSGATLALDGRAAAVLDPALFPEEQRRLIGEALAAHPWLYPPHLLLLVRPLGLLPYVAGWLLWSATGFAAFAFASYCAARRFALGFSGATLAGLLIAPAAMSNLISGQIGFFASALFVGGIAALDRRPLLAGVLFGLLTVKPHLGILVPCLLLACRAWIAIAAAVATTLVLLGVSVLVDGVEPWRLFVGETAAAQWDLLQHGEASMYARIPSVFGSLHRLGVPFEVSLAVQLVASVCAAGAVCVGLWRAANLLDRFMLIAVGAFLVAPYALHYDMSLLTIATLLYVTRWDAEMTAREHWLWFVLWLLHPLAIFLGVVGAVSGPLLLGTALAVVLRRIELHRAASSPTLDPRRQPPMVPGVP